MVRRRIEYQRNVFSMRGDCDWTMISIRWYDNGDTLGMSGWMGIRVSPLAQDHSDSVAESFDIASPDAQIFFWLCFDKVFFEA